MPRPEPSSHPPRPPKPSRWRRPRCRRHQTRPRGALSRGGACLRYPDGCAAHFNIYATRQSLSNPYTGVIAIFSSRVLNGNPPLVFEDGHQSRDFIHVSDVVRANLLALEREQAVGQVYNVGTGQRATVAEVAEILIRSRGAGLEPEIPSQYRAGDIRHCYADIDRISRDLGFAPRVGLEQGMADVVALGRPLLADPDLPRKMKEGRENEIMMCGACLQGCLARMF